PASCSAVVSPDSPMTYAVRSVDCCDKNFAVASAEVQILSAGISSHCERSRAARSRGVAMELLVKTMNFMSLSFNVCRNLSAPGIISPSLMSTPSMSDREEIIGVPPQIWLHRPAFQALEHRILRTSRPPDLRHAPRTQSYLTRSAPDHPSVARGLNHRVLPR